MSGLSGAGMIQTLLLLENLAKRLVRRKGCPSLLSHRSSRCNLRRCPLVILHFAVSTDGAKRDKSAQVISAQGGWPITRAVARTVQKTKNSFRNLQWPLKFTRRLIPYRCRAGAGDSLVVFKQISAPIPRPIPSRGFLLLVAPNTTPRIPARSDGIPETHEMNHEINCR
jgi:hypothetical protein